MQVLRNAHLLARFVLVWFALSIGAAIASPLIQPKDILLICTGSGAMKVLVQADDGSTEMTDCQQCAFFDSANAAITANLDLCDDEAVMTGSQLGIDPLDAANQHLLGAGGHIGQRQLGQYRGLRHRDSQPL